MKKNY